MARHIDFEKIHSRFINQFERKGETLYCAWLTKKGYDVITKMISF